MGGLRIQVGNSGCTAQALAEKEGEGMAKMIYRKDSGEILGVHIIGLHAADLIHEASNAVATGQTVKARSVPSLRHFWLYVHPAMPVSCFGTACLRLKPGPLHLRGTTKRLKHLVGEPNKDVGEVAL